MTRALAAAETGRIPRHREALRARLEALREEGGAGTPDGDPLEFVHRYREPEDREAAGLIAAVLAYGRVARILESVETVLRPLGPRPASAVDALQRLDALRLYRGFRHRFNDGRDIACLLDIIRRMRTAHGSIGACFRDGDPGGTTVEGGLAAFSSRALALADPRFYGSRTLPLRAGVRYFFPSPAGGSAVKRLCLFLRWMVRGPDGVDVGLWRDVGPGRLVVPLDTHVARIARCLGLTGKRQANWAAALEVTARLRELDPGDPVRYDYALCRLGILGRCPSRRDAGSCAACSLARFRRPRRSGSGRLAMGL
jgi:uncharacterized protein (TIGR02757 family)